MLRDDLVVPTWVGTKHPYHFHSAAAWLMFAGFVCSGASVVVVISRRLKAEPGEKTDQRLAQSMAIAGAFIILAMILRPARALGRSPQGARPCQAQECGNQDHRRLHSVQAALPFPRHLGAAQADLRCLGLRALPMGHRLANPVKNSTKGSAEGERLCGR
jgi:hypothetical protein